MEETNKTRELLKIWHNLSAEQRRKIFARGKAILDKRKLGYLFDLLANTLTLALVIFLVSFPFHAKYLIVSLMAGFIFTIRLLGKIDPGRND